MGTAVNDKNFHKIIFYMMQIYYFLTYHSESAYMEAALSPEPHANIGYFTLTYLLFHFNIFAI